MSSLNIPLTLFFILFSCSQLSQVASQAKIEVCSDNYSDKNVDGCLIIVENCVVLWMNSIQVEWEINEKPYFETINPKTNKPVVKSDCSITEPNPTGQAVGSNLTLSFTTGLKNASSIDLDLTITSNKANRYWIVDRASIKIDSQEFNLKATELTAADTFSFSCSSAIVQSIKSSKDTSKDFAIVQIKRLQLQPFKAKNTKEHFTYSYDCATWFTLGTWMGLLALLLFISIVSFGVYMLSTIETMDRFENPKAKPLSIPVSE